MSKFTSKIATEVDALIALLPKGSYIHSIVLNKDTHGIEIEWSNEIFQSGLTVSVDFDPADIKAKRLPKGVWNARKGKPATLTPPAPEIVPTVTQAPAKPILTPWLSEEQVLEAIKEGKEVEFMGVTPSWLPFNAQSDAVTPGYFYRLVEKPVDTKTQPA